MIQMVKTVQIAAENRLFFNSTTMKSLLSRKNRLQTQFVIIQITVQYLELETIFLFLMKLTLIPNHMPILVIVIRMLPIFMRMLIPELSFQGLSTL